MSTCLKLISHEETLLLGPTDGLETLAHAKDLFRYVDSNFERWNCCAGEPPTTETPVRVYEVVSNSTFQEMFCSLGIPLDRLALTQAQIKQFVRRYREWLKRGGNGTFFLFNTNEEYFVAAVYLFLDGRLGARARRFTLDRVFRAKKGHRLVVKSD